MKRYLEAKSDHDYLWKTYGPADDMTGGYVDQEDLKRMLDAPTKKMAVYCLARQIHYWFQMPPKWPLTPGMMDDHRVVEIRDKYCAY